MITVDKVIIFTIYGNPIVLFDFNSEQMVVDEMLLSGFLSAIDGFSSQLFQSNSKQMSIDTGKGIISLFKNDKIIITIIADTNLVRMADEIHKIIEYFSRTHDTDSSLMHSPEEFWEARQKLIRVLYRIPISEDWIVVFNPNASKSQQYMSHYPEIFTSISKTEIKSLPIYMNMEKESLYTILNAAYHDKVIIFENMIEGRDYVFGAEKITKILNTNSDDYRILRNSFPKTNIAAIIQDLSCAVRVKEILDTHGQQSSDLIHYLFENEYIHLVDETNRRIYISMELALGIINIVNTLTNKKKVQDTVKNALIELNDPGVTHKFEFQNDEVKIIKDACYADVLTEMEIQDLMKKWVDLSKLLIEAFYPKFKNKLIEKIYEFFTQEYLNNAHSYDLGVLDSILALLEKYMK
jgi:L-rhamnose mutarotase